MNVKNMRKLRARLRSRKNPVGFNMTNWFQHRNRSLVTPAGICRAAEQHACGTVACLAGHAALLAWQSGDVPKNPDARVYFVARDWLGMEDEEVQDLFYGCWPAVRGVYIGDITEDQAIAELTRLIEAEIMTWTRTRAF